MISSKFRSLRAISSSLRVNYLQLSCKRFKLTNNNKEWKSLNENRVKFGYFTLVDKPIQSATLNSIIELGAEFMYFPFINWSWPAESSIFIGAVAYRILIELATKFIENLKYENFQNRFFYKMIKKIFLIDLNRDINFYVCYLLHSKRISIKSSPQLSLNTIGLDIQLRIALLQVLFHKKFYLNLNFMRAAHYILVNQSFSSFHLHTSIFPTLTAYDPSFMLPLIPMGLTYMWISGSRHPLLIHLSRPQNLFFRINIAFMAGLIFVPLPTIYSLTYAGLLTGHLIIRKIYHQKSDIKEDVSNFFKKNPQPLQKAQKSQQNSSRIQNKQKGADEHKK